MINMNGKTWSVSEVSKMTRMLAAGASVQKVADALGRTADAVHYKMYECGLKRKKLQAIAGQLDVFSKQVDQRALLVRAKLTLAGVDVPKDRIETVVGAVLSVYRP